MEKIFFTKGDKIEHLSDFLITNTGEYNSLDLVEVSLITDPDLPIVAYQAFFLKYGFNYEVTE